MGVLSEGRARPGMRESWPSLTLWLGLTLGIAVIVWTVAYLVFEWLR